MKKPNLALLGLLLLFLAGPFAVARAAGNLDVTLTAAGSNKLQVIAIVRELTGLGLKDAKELVEAAPSIVLHGKSPAEAELAKRRLVMAGATVYIGISGVRAASAASAPSVASAPSATSRPIPVSAPPPSGPQMNPYDVVLLACGGNKPQVINVVREITGLGWREATELVESAPKVVRTETSQAGAEAIKRKLMDAGATVSVGSMTASAPQPAPASQPATGPQMNPYDVVLLSYGGNKAQVIKAVMMLTGQNMNDSKTLVESAPKVVRTETSQANADAAKRMLMEAGATVAIGSMKAAAETAAPAPAVAAPARRSNQFEVVLIGCGANKAQVIKAVMALTGQNMNDSKTLVESTPRVVRIETSQADAEATRRKLMEAGASVEIR